MARKFFVGGDAIELFSLNDILTVCTGNFKMNGSKESLSKLVGALNEAKLNPDVGM